VAGKAERPRQVPTGRCRACGRHTFGLAAVCRRRKCPGYAPLWAGDQRRKLFENLSAYTDGNGSVLLGAVTPPGAQVLPWDRSWCSHREDEKCSGERGCRVDVVRATGWNLKAPENWRRLHRRAYEYVKKNFGIKPVLLARVWEVQKRGVLHVHPVLAAGTPVQRHAAAIYLDAIQRFGPQYGFGFSKDRAKPMANRAAAAYLSAYFVKGKKGKVALHESVMHPAMPRSIIHVSRELTTRTGVTMRELRFRRFVWIVAPGLVRLGHIELARRIALYVKEHRGEQVPLELLSSWMAASGIP
jgi:hypothetical protein